MYRAALTKNTGLGNVKFSLAGEENYHGLPVASDEWQALSTCEKRAKLAQALRARRAAGDQHYHGLPVTSDEWQALRRADGR